MNAVLLHGWGVSKSVFNEYAGVLGSFNKLSTPCLYELAASNNENSFQSVATAINEIVEEDTILIAWSIGGLIAINVANLTNKIKAIIFIASTPCFVNKNDWKNVIDESGIKDLASRLSKDTKGALEYFAGLIAHGDKPMKETNKVIRNNLAAVKHKPVLSQWLDQMLVVDERTTLSELNIPVLFIAGSNDSLIKPELKGQIVLLNPSISFEVIDECGHAPFINKQKETQEIIDKFINAKFS